MEQKDIDKIAETIATKIGQPGGGNRLMGCGSASSSEHYNCSGTYSCSSYYECGGAANFDCSTFTCDSTFSCTNDNYHCSGTFRCNGTYNY